MVEALLEGQEQEAFAKTMLLENPPHRAGTPLHFSLRKALKLFKLVWGHWAVDISMRASSGMESAVARARHWRRTALATPTATPSAGQAPPPTQHTHTLWCEGSKLTWRRKRERLGWSRLGLGLCLCLCLCLPLGSRGLPLANLLDSKVSASPRPLARRLHRFQRQRLCWWLLQRMERNCHNLSTWRYNWGFIKICTVSRTLQAGLFWGLLPHFEGLAPLETQEASASR